MKILHITNSLSEGGVESFLLNLLPRLREKGYAVELLVLNRNSVSMKKVFEDNGIKVNIGKYNNLGIYTLFTLIFKKLTFMIINFKLFVIFAPNIRIRLDFSNRSNDI